ncbi:hypothetical protein B0J17DRAFT_724453 [Rhizoctonia solani]|nr:hypothetical protein B0J17DRAFT_724453 [Rhizoctonia solani]
MTHLGISLYGHETCPQALQILVRMLESSPNLVDLESIGGDRKPCILVVDDSPEAHGLRSFFQRNTQLREVNILPRHHIYQAESTIEPRALYVILPSLELFAGPVSICSVLAASPIAKSLGFVFEEDGPPQFNRRAIQTIVQNASVLPELENIGILSFTFRSGVYNQNPDSLDMATLTQLFQMAPKLQRIRQKLPLCNAKILKHSSKHELS